MKRCQECGTCSGVDTLSCSICGGASWAPVVEDAIADEAQPSKVPPAKKAKG